MIFLAHNKSYRTHYKYVRSCTVPYTPLCSIERSDPDIRINIQRRVYTVLVSRSGILFLSPPHANIYILFTHKLCLHFALLHSSTHSSLIFPWSIVFLPFSFKYFPFLSPPFHVYPPPKCFSKKYTTVLWWVQNTCTSSKKLSRPVPGHNHSTPRKELPAQDVLSLKI